MLARRAMKTPLEIDSGLAAKIEAAAKARGISTREFVRAALLHALKASSAAGGKARFVQRVHDFGIHIEVPWTLLSDLESDDYAMRFRK